MQKETLSSIVKEARESKGISQRELARQINVDNSSIAKIEKGLRTQPNVLIIRKIANILELDEVELLKVAGYTEDDINFTIGQTEINIITYFEKSSLSDIQKMIERLKEEKLRCSEMSLCMKDYDIHKIKASGNMTQEHLDKLKNNWDKDIEDYISRVDEYEKIIDQLENIIDLRKQNGEKADNPSKDIKIIIEKYIKSINNK